MKGERQGLIRMEGDGVVGGLKACMLDGGEGVRVWREEKGGGGRTKAERQQEGGKKRTKDRGKHCKVECKLPHSWDESG